MDAMYKVYLFKDSKGVIEVLASTKGYEFFHPKHAPFILRDGLTKDEAFELESKLTKLLK